MGWGSLSGRIAVVGTGVIGASWAAYFLAKGFDVAATDPAAGAERHLRTLVDGFWPALERVGFAEGASRSRLRFDPDIRRTVEGCAFIQENGPERVLCHEHHRSKRRCGTVREMKEGPSGSAIRSQIPSHRKLLWSKVTVVSVAETPGR